MAWLGLVRLDSHFQISAVVAAMGSNGGLCKAGLVDMDLHSPLSSCKKTALCLGGPFVILVLNSRKLFGCFVTQDASKHLFGLKCMTRSMDNP